MSTTTPPAQWSAHDRLEHEIAVLLRRARGLSGSIARAVHPDLDSAAYGLMVRIEEVGAVRITDLAEYFTVGKPTVSRQIALLESLGLVTRAPNSEDARSRHLSLTEDGRDRLAAARAARRRNFEQMLGDWSSDDVATLAGLLQRFNAVP